MERKRAAENFTGFSLLTNWYNSTQKILFSVWFVDFCSHFCVIPERFHTTSKLNRIQ